MPMPMNKGAKIVINQWCRVKPGENVLIISDDTHVKEDVYKRQASTTPR